MSEILARRHGVKIQQSSRILREQWFYDATYLAGRDESEGPCLFVRHFVEYETKAGNVRRRFAVDVLGFDDEEAMYAWIEEHQAEESGDPDGVDRGWVPDEWAGAKRA